MPDEILQETQEEGMTTAEQEDAAESQSIDAQAKKSYDELMAEIGEETSQPDEQSAEGEGQEEEQEEQQQSAAKRYVEKIKQESTSRRQQEQLKSQLDTMQAQMQQVQPFLQALQQSRQENDGGLALLQALGFNPEDTVRGMLGQEKPAPTADQQLAAMQQQFQQLQQQLQQQQYQQVQSNYFGQYSRAIDPENDKDGEYEALRDYYAITGEDPTADAKAFVEDQFKQYHRTLHPSEVASILNSEAEKRLTDQGFRKEFEERFKRMQTVREKMFGGSTTQAAAPSASGQRPQQQKNMRPGPAPQGGGKLFADRDSVSEDEMADAIKRKFSAMWESEE
jgi:hypothetical protein